MALASSGVLDAVMGSHPADGRRCEWTGRGTAGLDRAVPAWGVMCVKMALPPGRWRRL